MRRASQGYAYYPEGGIGEPGFTEDRISTGGFALVATESGKVDMIFSDASGVPRSARADGGKIEVLGGEEGLIITVNPPEVSDPRVVSFSEDARPSHLGTVRGGGLL